MCRAGRPLAIAALLVVVATSGCEQLAGRSENRKGNEAFREMRFAAAVAHYERAIRRVDDPIIHYNLALAYSKVFKPGGQGNIVIDRTDAATGVCRELPSIVAVSKRVCVKPGDLQFTSCDDRRPCGSGFRCEATELCAVDNKKLADLAATHFTAWLASNPKDAETRAMMTQVWIDSAQYPKAIAYWEQLNMATPNDPTIMGNLAGIYLKANDWRRSIEWYSRVARSSKEESAQVAAYQFIGNVAWAKLNSRTLPSEQSVELADLGIGALQKAAELQPENPKLFTLMASIYYFRALQHGASWAAAIDRATAADLQRVAHGLRQKTQDASKGNGASTSTKTSKVRSSRSPISASKVDAQGT